MQKQRLKYFRIKCKLQYKIGQGIKQRQPGQKVHSQCENQEAFGAGY